MGRCRDRGEYSECLKYNCCFECDNKNKAFCNFMSVCFPVYDGKGSEPKNCAKYVESEEE